MARMVQCVKLGTRAARPGENRPSPVSLDSAIYDNIFAGRRGDMWQDQVAPSSSITTG